MPQSVSLPRALSTSLQRRSEKAAAFVIVAIVHVVIIGALLSYQPFREALISAAPIMVNLVTMPKAPEVTPSVTEPPKPLPVAKPRPQPARKPIERPLIAAATTDASTTFIASKPAPEPLPPEPAPSAAEPGPPPPVTPPNFNADYLRNPAPPYPPLARRMGEQGRVILRVLVSAEGMPERVELRRSSGSPRLDESALNSVRAWKFLPARQGDHPVAAWVLVPISFSLQG